MTAATPVKPTAPAVLAENIPADLTDRPQWVGWVYEFRAGKGDKPGKWTKRPVNVRTGRAASTTDLTTWVSFADALAYYRAGRCDGIGFVFSSGDPFTGIDLDHCRDPAAGEVAPWAREILDDLAGYAEVSPSLTGVKVFVRAKLPGGGRRSAYGGGELEMYSAERFFTVTGHVLPGGAP